MNIYFEIGGILVIVFLLWLMSHAMLRQWEYLIFLLEQIRDRLPPPPAKTTSTPKQ